MMPVNHSSAQHGTTIPGYNGGMCTLAANNSLLIAFTALSTREQSFLAQETQVLSDSEVMNLGREPITITLIDKNNVVVSVYLSLSQHLSVILIRHLGNWSLKQT